MFILSVARPSHHITSPILYTRKRSGHMTKRKRKRRRRRRRRRDKRRFP